MKTQQQYFDEINNNWYKFQTNVDCYVKRRLRKLTTKNLEYVNSLLREQISNLTGSPSEISVTSCSNKRIIKYIDNVIVKRNKQEVENE